MATDTSEEEGLSYVGKVSRYEGWGGRGQIGGQDLNNMKSRSKHLLVLKNSCYNFAASFRGGRHSSS